MKLFKTLNNVTVMIIDRYKIEFDKETSNKILNYYRFLPEYSEEELLLEIKGIDTSSGLTIDVVFDDYIIKIDEDIYILPNLDRNYIIEILEDSSDIDSIF